MSKRKNFLTWNDYFMGLALLSAERSKDPNTQVGACIVNKDNKILSVGYNGLPIGYPDDDFHWDKREGESIETKYPYVVHAEINAIINSKADLAGSTIYVTLFPCNECTKAIIQAGIKHIVYLCDKYQDQPSIIASKRMLDKVNVTYEKYKPDRESIVLNLIDGAKK